MRLSCGKQTRKYDGKQQADGAVQCAAAFGAQTIAGEKQKSGIKEQRGGKAGRCDAQDGASACTGKRHHGVEREPRQCGKAVRKRGKRKGQQRRGKCRHEKQGNERQEQDVCGKAEHTDLRKGARHDGRCKQRGGQRGGQKAGKRAAEERKMRL